MTSLADLLNQHLDRMQSEGGLSTLHLLGLPTAVNRVMRVFLRNKQLSLQSLRQIVDEMPAESRLTYQDLDELLKVLCDREWLVRTEEEGEAYYGINLRPAIASASGKTVEPAAGGPAQEAWEKAGLGTASEPVKKASQIHADILGAISSAQSEESEEVRTVDQGSPEPDRHQTPQTNALEADRAEAAGEDKPVAGSISADDLWNLLDNKE